MEGWIYLILLCGIFIGMVLFFTKSKRGPADQQTYQMMQSFANELVSENQRLMQTMLEINKKTEEKLTQVYWSMEQLESRISQLEKQLFIPNGSLASTAGGEDHVSDGKQRTDHDILHLRNRYKAVFDLCNQGYTIEEISKELGYGKGELELILQLAGHR